MGLRLKKTVVMVGMMGAGKTAVGHSLARRLDVPFVDSDDEIEKAANMSIPEIFARDGEAFFRRKESQVIARLLNNGCCVLSTGGGAFLSAENRAMISQRGVSVWLNAGLDLLWLRVRHKQTRPLLRTADPRRTLEQIHAARAPFYALADLTVEVRANYSVADTTGAVISALRSRPDVLEME